jgi:hypothetical protein
VQSFLAEYPDLSEPVFVIAEQLQQKFTKQLEGVALALFNTVKPAIDGYGSSEAERHLNTIRDAHSDFERIRDSGDLVSWIKEQPAYKQEAYIKAYNQGSAEEVIDLIGDYKRAKGLTRKQSEPTATPPANEERLAGLEAVKSKRGPVSARATGAAGKDDYEGAFAEAVGT